MKHHRTKGWKARRKN